MCLVQNLNEGGEDLDSQNALNGLWQASQSQESVLDLASTLQECLQALIESREKSQSKESVRFKNNPGSAIQGANLCLACKLPLFVC